MRNRVYSATLIQSRPIRICAPLTEYSQRALLGVCRQIYQEAVWIFYSGNVFISEATGPSPYHRLSFHFIRWLWHLGPRKRALLRDIRVCTPPPEEPTSLEQGNSNVDEYCRKRSFLVDCFDQLILKGLWLPLTVLRVRINAEFLNFVEILDVHDSIGSRNL